MQRDPPKWRVPLSPALLCLWSGPLAREGGARYSWKAAAAAVEADWVKEVQGKGIDGAKLVAEARALIAKQAK